MNFRRFVGRKGFFGTLLILAACLPIPILFAVDDPFSKNARAGQTEKPGKSLAYFTDVAKQAGLTMLNVFGGVTTKKYIIETTGTGVAIFDYDNDGWPDIFIVNGTTLGAQPGTPAPTNHLFHNNHDGTFTDVTDKAGLRAAGWGQGVCAGDYDNDGFDDPYV